MFGFVGCFPLNAKGFLNNLLGGEVEEDCLKSSNPKKFLVLFIF